MMSSPSQLYTLILGLLAAATAEQICIPPAFTAQINGGGNIVSAQSAREIVAQRESKILKEKINILEKENKLLKERNQIDKHILELEKEDHEKTKSLLKNSDSVVKFLFEVIDQQDSLFDIIIGNYKPIDVRKDQKDDTEGQLIKLLMKNEKLIKKQRSRILALEDKMKHEKAAHKSQVEFCSACNQSCSHLEMISTLLATISHKENTIDSMRSLEANSEEINGVIKDMSVILLNLEWEAGAETGASGICSSVIENQSRTLKLIKAHLGYLKENHRSVRFVEDVEGNVIEGKMCKCIPEIAPVKNASTSASLQSLGFQCPSDHVSKSQGNTFFNIDCPGGPCPSIMDEECEPELRKPWTEWDNYCQDQENCLGGKYRKRLMRNSSKDGFHEELQVDNKGKFVILEESQTVVIEGAAHIGLFAVGGGGGGDVDESAGSSGFFVYTFYQKADGSGPLSLNITIGRGGAGHGGHDGGVTRVLIGNKSVEAKGGGGNGRSGWSGGGDNGGDGGFNGSSGKGSQDVNGNGSGAELPVLCRNVKLHAGAHGQGMKREGGGGGGILIEGRKSCRNNWLDGEGYGAGGGEDDQDGSPGVVVLMLCDF